jgi:hypothetical protein
MTQPPSHSRWSILRKDPSSQDELRLKSRWTARSEDAVVRIPASYSSHSFNFELETCETDWHFLSFSSTPSVKCCDCSSEHATTGSFRILHNWINWLERKECLCLGHWTCSLSQPPKSTWPYASVSQPVVSVPLGLRKKSRMGGGGCTWTQLECLLLLLFFLTNKYFCKLLPVQEWSMNKT